MTNHTDRRFLQPATPHRRSKRVAWIMAATSIGLAGCGGSGFDDLIADDHETSSVTAADGRKSPRQGTRPSTPSDGPAETPATPVPTPPASDAPPTDEVPDTAPLPPLEPVTDGAFRDVFGDPVGSADGDATTSPDDTPPATDPPTTDPPATDAPPPTNPPATSPPTTTPPVTAPPTTAPPATDPPPVPPPAETPGVPIAALAPNVNEFLSGWNSASQQLVDTSEADFLPVAFVPDTFVTSPALSGNGSTTVGRDTTEEIFVGISTNDAGAVTGMILGGHADNTRPLSAIAALWVRDDFSVNGLFEAYLTTIDADVDDITVTADDGGTWNIIDLEQTIVFGKAQNADPDVAASGAMELLLEVIALLPPLS